MFQKKKKIPRSFHDSKGLLAAVMKPSNWDLPIKSINNYRQRDLLNLIHLSQKLDAYPRKPLPYQEMTRSVCSTGKLVNILKKIGNTYQKWPTGPTKPNPNILVTATRLQLMINLASASYHIKCNFRLPKKALPIPNILKSSNQRFNLKLPMPP